MRCPRELDDTGQLEVWHDSVCNTVQEPTVTSTIVAKKTTTWGESGFPSEFLGGRADVLHVSHTDAAEPEAETMPNTGPQGAA